MLEEVLDTPTPAVGTDDHARIFSAKKDAAVSIINMNLKADENCLRHRKNDILDKLFERVWAKHGPIIEASAASSPALLEQPL